MNLVTLTGIRGGGGTTTMVGMLGDALHALGQRVLLVDLNASDLLRMHFDVPHADGRGWVASLFPDEWNQQAFQLDNGLMLVPFGRQAIAGFGISHLLRGDDFWLQVLPTLERDFDWVLFDCPPCPHRLAAALRFRSTLDLMVANPDIAARELLSQINLEDSSYLLINDFDPTRRLECDVLAGWQHHYGDRVLAQTIYSDENLPEALASKRPVTRYSPDAAASQAARSLARWCLSVQRAAVA
ncbi:MAG: cellulose biosynthesis protein BcsQ [Castellaniella sp.]|uniref:cellulose biosynthesis protein BcsQ n=1 Tax=Castellaniella sp. TaxID=1955812 RepID=UPI003C73B7D5